ncbi:GNAT family N-acetyltransferase [Brevibacillus daliensis]|uniref:GNAT family N-acetyltransferase n=1 Tax=Brevibacillus daliensis TaxID=2892995 RepID=UPI002815FC71|nr:GNAT family protein [Brevibacillus daliensis]
MNTYPVLITKRLMLLHLSMHHVDDLFEIFSNEKTTDHVPREVHVSKSETVSYLEKKLADSVEGKSFIWAVSLKETGKIIGVAGMFNYSLKDRSASLGSVINPEYRGNGYISEAFKEIIRYAFTELGLARIEGKCESSNHASERLIHKLGMVHEGTLRKNILIKGTLRDTKIYSILQEEYKDF